ncbi:MULTISPECIES: non-heme iron oxygenase ferredoxin subunit [unclassified Serinicoccus]|jgi:3-phenylpropionate/trans-cinnamate dioxygenase ferredoxin subunit|uniref:non-heme iron oxygenase ferredoxin subunit n=1 Tax=unclassified Serinicoccus TaxID=2643101 RepID=UPI003852C7F1
MSAPVRVCTVDELPTSVGAVVALVDGRKVTIARDSQGRLHAFDDTCSHANVSLAEGEIENGFIECWLHGSQFDMTTGRPVQLPATQPIAVHDLTVDDDGGVYVTVNGSAAGA